MILVKVKQYLMNQRLVSLSELTTRFNLDPEVLRNMLRLLIQKGKLRQKSKTNHCGSKCTKCAPGMTEMYEWVEI